MALEKLNCKTQSIENLNCTTRITTSILVLNHDILMIDHMHKNLISNNLISRVMVIFWLTLIACISYVTIHMKQYYSDSLKKMDSQQSKPVVLVYWFHFFIASFAVVSVLLLTFRHSPLSWKISCQPNVEERFKLTLLRKWKRYLRSMMIKVHGKRTLCQRLMMGNRDDVLMKA